MSKFLRVAEGDYIVETKEGGEIFFNTGNSLSPSGPGQVRISGNLLVEGETTTVESSTLTVQDNIIVVNQGETGDGVTIGSAGLEVNRGNLANAQLVFQEDIDSFVFKFNDQSDTLTSIRADSINFGTRSITQNANVLSIDDVTPEAYLGFLKNTTGVDENAIPNKLYVDDAVLGAIGINRIAQGEASESFVEVQDNEISGIDSKVVVVIDQQTDPTANFYEDHIELQNIDIDTNTISGKTDPDPVTGIRDDDNVTLRANKVAGGSITNTVIINNNLTIPKPANVFEVPTTPSNGVKIFAGVQDVGGTGIYFVNENSTTDELVSKGKSILYGIIF